MFVFVASGRTSSCRFFFIKIERKREKKNPSRCSQDIHLIIFMWFFISFFKTYFIVGTRLSFYFQLLVDLSFSLSLCVFFSLSFSLSCWAHLNVLILCRWIMRVFKLSEILLGFLVHSIVKCMAVLRFPRVRCCARPHHQSVIYDAKC